MLFRSGEAIPVIIVEHKGRRLAYSVSDFMNPQKLVISAFDRSLAVPGLVGTAVLSGRQLCMIIDVPALFAQTLGLSRDALGNGAGPTSVGAAATHSPAAVAPAGASVREGEGTDRAFAEPGDSDALDAYGVDRPGMEFLQERSEERRGGQEC